jgi:RNA polymerase sigma-70 factor (ECF subfamily)
LDERELIALLKQKDNNAFRQIVTNWQKLVYNTVLGLLQNEEDAEDVSQEVFIQVYESVQSFKQESKLSTWLYRIAVSKSIDHLRKKNAKKRFAFLYSVDDNEHIKNLVPDFYHPGVKLEQKEDAAILFKAISFLPKNQKVAFVLNKIEGLSYTEIAEVLLVSTSAVDSLLHRAKNNLKKHLSHHFKKSVVLSNIQFE